MQAELDNTKQQLANVHEVHKNKSLGKKADQVGRGKCHGAAARAKRTLLLVAET